MLRETSLPKAEEIGNLVPIGQIAKSTPYSADFLRQLAHSSRIRAFKFNRDWLSTRQAVLDYVKEQEERHTKQLGLLRTAERSLR